MPHDVFISYSEKDKPTADAACFALESKQVRCWIAPRDILAGVNWGEAIVDAIAQAKVMVLVFSSHANRSPQVMREVERAVNKGIPILPFRIEDVPLSKAFEYYISTRHWLDALTPPLEQHLRKLATTVQRLLTPADDDTQIELDKGGNSTQSNAHLTGSPILESPESLVGFRVGAFLLQKPIGSGGSGCVFVAWNSALAREACIKVFRPMRADFAGLSATIARAVRALAAIDHPNIIKVFDFGPVQLQDASSFYLAMEMIHGTTLDEWSRILPQDEAGITERLRLALAVTEALEVAHNCRYIDDVGFEQTGLLHGDIKPTNILVRPDSSPVLLDFMMADVQRLLDIRVLPPSGLPGVNRADTMAFGTPGFMAPEQEEKGIVTVKTDIYSLGVTLCHLFAPDAANPFAHIRESSDSRISALFPLLATMLSNDPLSRPRDMGAVAHQLRLASGTDHGRRVTVVNTSESDAQSYVNGKRSKSIWGRLFSKSR